LPGGHVVVCVTVAMGTRDVISYVTSLPSSVRHAKSRCAHRLNKVMLKRNFDTHRNATIMFHMPVFSVVVVFFFSLSCNIITHNICNFIACVLGGGTLTRSSFFAFTMDKKKPALHASKLSAFIC